MESSIESIQRSKISKGAERGTAIVRRKPLYHNSRSKDSRKISKANTLTKDMAMKTPPKGSFSKTSTHYDTEARVQKRSTVYGSAGFRTNTSIGSRWALKDNQVNDKHNNEVKPATHDSVKDTPIGRSSLNKRSRVTNLNEVSQTRFK